MLRVAINGFGRIGRNVLRACYESGYSDKIQIVAINDLSPPDTNAHLLQYDTAHGHFPFKVSLANNNLTIGDNNIRMLSERHPANLPWRELSIDLVMECTGLFTTREAAELHIEAGSRKVLLSAPGKNMDATVVYGINHHSLKATDTIISNASCTTNCLAPLASVLHSTVGIQQGLATTVHAFTNDQVLTDVYNPDLRRARSATQSMIPTKTGAAAAISDVIPELSGKLDGLAIRVPIINVSLLDLTFTASHVATAEQINQAMAKAAEQSLKGVLAINQLPLVSCDFNHNSASCIFDATQTRVQGNLVKVLAWYDNEWGFSNRMLDSALAIAEAD